MCYYFSQTKDTGQIQKRFNAKLRNPELFTASDQYNGFEFPKTLVIVNSNPELIDLGNWGLIPIWSDKGWSRNFTLNSKIETIQDKPAFKDVVKNRCLILTDGFFEWQHRGKQKIKYKISFGNELFALAGIYSIFEDEIYYSVVTTEAKGVMREIHNVKFRMPFALKTNQDFDLWLNQKTIEPRFDFTTETRDDIQMSLF